MYHNLIGLLASFVFVFLILLVSELIKLHKKVDVEVSRKIVHIGSSNWWWIAMYFFDSPLWASIPPIFFIFFNIASKKFNLIKSMERQSPLSEAKDYGTVFYSISLLIISIVCFAGLVPLYAGTIAIFCMGYGDGFAALVGKRFGKHKLRFVAMRKSLEGSISMFVISFILSAAILSYHNGSFVLIYAAFIAVVSTCLEMLAPSGYDNLSVPLGVGLFVYVIL